MTDILRSHTEEVGNMNELAELLSEYGQAKFGDEWWPGESSSWLTAEKASRLAQLLESESR